MAAIAIGLATAAVSIHGIGQLMRYENSPGEEGRPPSQWPATTRLERASNSPTLVLLLHPRCSCSEATLEELQGVLAHSLSKMAVNLVFVKPPGAPAGWEKGDLWNEAAAIPGVRLTVDEDGAEAAAFGLATSGHALLFDPKGRLLFSGGITEARGHAGANASADTLLAAVNQAPVQPGRTSVFGCPLLHPLP